MEVSVTVVVENTVEPTELLVFLGIEFGTNNMIMRLHEDKRAELKTRILFCLDGSKLPFGNINYLLAYSTFRAW